MQRKSCLSAQSHGWVLKFIASLIFLLIGLYLPLLPAQAADANQIQAVNLLQIPVARTLRLEKMVLDNENTPTSLELERFEVFAPDVRITVRDGQGNEQLLPRPATAYFKGQIAGDPDSLVVLSADPDGTLRGLAQQGKKLWVLAGGAAVGGPPLGLVSREVAQSGALSGLTPFECGVEGRTQELTPPTLPRLTLPAVPLAAGQFYQVPVAIETDGEFYNLLGSSSAATSYIGDLFAYASVIYNREASAKLIVSSVSLWSGGPTADPWNHSSTSNGLTDFGNYWNANRTTVKRAIAHFLSGRELGGGIAWLGALCDSGYGYGYSANLKGQFQIGNPQPVWDIVVVSHEIGHNFSSPHTHCYANIGGNNNPVDACYGTGGNGCWSGTTSLPGVNSLTGGTAGGGNGTIMSYCHLLSGGMSNIALTFGQNHPHGIAASRVSSKIADYVASVAANYPNCISIGNDGGGAYALTLLKAGTGSGTVSGNGNYAAGAAVNLTAVAATGSIFIGWSPSPCAASFTMPASNLTCTATFTLTQTSQPDLIVTAVTSPTTGVAGGKIEVSETVKNQGGQAAGETGVGFYLSTDSTITPSDIFTTYGCGIATIAAGESLSCGGLIEIPASVPAGSYYLGAYADDFNTIAENNETNNGLAATNKITITGGVPIYALTVLKAGTGTGTVSGGGSYAAAATVNLTATANTGSTFAGWSPSPCATSFAMPTNNLTCTATFTAIPPNTYTVTVTKAGTGAGVVSGGGSYAAAVTVNLTATANTGSTFVGWSPSPCAASFAMPTSNLTCTATFTLTQTTQPDLIVTAVTSPTTGVAGGQIEVSRTVKNQGGQTAGQFWTPFYLSTDSTITPSDINTDYGCQSSSLAVAESKSCGGLIEIPASIPAGVYYLGAYVDSDNTVAESNETNNGLAATNKITITGGSQTFGSAVGVFRNGQWFLDANANGAWDGCGTEFCFSGFGQAGDLPASGNWDGGTKGYIGVLRSGTGQWFVDRNGNRQWDGCVADGCYSGFGAPGDLPVAGDWRGTGFAKIGVFRNGQWYLDANGNGAWDGCGAELCLNFGQAGDLPVAGNWNGGVSSGVGVFRAGTWYLDYNGNGAWDGCSVDRCYANSFGQAGDFPAAGDWNGDGKAKVGVFRNGTWYLDYNGNGAWDGCGVDRCYFNSFGQAGDWPVAGKW